MDQEACVRYMKKQYRMTSVLTMAAAGLFLVVLVCAFLLVPKAMGTLNKADQALTDLDQVLGNLEQVTAELTEANLPRVVENLDSLILESAQSVEEVMEKVNTMDLDTLNAAINDLQAVVEPLAKLFGRF